MTNYAVGKPGGAVRAYVQASSQAVADRQCAAGEIAAALDAPPPQNATGATISTGGVVTFTLAPAPTLADQEAALLAAIDVQRETQQMAVLTTGGAKKYVYNRKAVEAIDSRSLVVSALNALSLTDKQKRFPFAQAEAVLTGETLSTVLARYEAGLAASATKIAAIEAQAQIAKRKVRAATTLAAKQAAAQVTWSS